MICRLLILAGLLLAASSSGHASATERPHVLFVAVDDLRPELGCYGENAVQSPVLDRLASEGIRFDRAYCQQAICGPSRASLMTGCRPETIGVIENTADFRRLNPDLITLPQHFAHHGYETVYCGKIYHGRMTDPEHSWTRRPAWHRMKLERPQNSGGYALPENQAIWKENRETIRAQYGKDGSSGLIHGPAYEAAAVGDHAYQDGFNTRLAIATLQDHLATAPDKPLFLGLGFHKPHLNFIAPKRYWDMYDREAIELANHTRAPRNGAAVGLHASFELRVRHGIPKFGPIPNDQARTLKHGYYACVSYVDAQIGLMIQALEEAGIRDNTIIVVWGDHGWHLGDMGVWGKATNYEIGTRVPLIVSTPHMRSPGRSTDSIVELLDLYPTLCELAAIPVPAHCEGQSFAPLLEDEEWVGKNYAVSQFPCPALREWAANPLSTGMRQTFFGPLIRQVEDGIIRQQADAWDRDLYEHFLMGYALRTARYRLVVWRDRRDAEAEPVFVELYDHTIDPKETDNVAAAHPAVVETLCALLDARLATADGMPR